SGRQFAKLPNILLQRRQHDCSPAGLPLSLGLFGRRSLLLHRQFRGVMQTILLFAHGRIEVISAFLWASGNLATAIRWACGGGCRRSASEDLVMCLRVAR